MHSRKRSATCLVATLMMLAPFVSVGQDAQLLNESMNVTTSASPARSGDVRPTWIYGSGTVQASQYRLLVVANTNFVDLVVYATSGSKCSIKRAAARDVNGVPIKPAVALALLNNEQNVAMRLSQSAAVSFVYLYNDANSGTCTAYVQLT
jgi:hypothetical protein